MDRQQASFRTSRRSPLNPSGNIAMNTKLLAAFLLVSLSSGCVVVSNGNGNGNPPPPPPPVAGDVTFHWSMAGYTCAQTPDVHTIRVQIPGEALANNGLFPCLVNGYPGIVLHDFAPGGYSFILQGLGGSNEVLYEASGTFTVNGNVDVTVSMASVASYAFVSWRLPPTGSSSNPNCSQAGVTYMDVWIDGVEEGRFFCTQGFGSASIPTRYLGIGTHAITLLAVDSTGYPLYRFDGPLVIQANSAVSALYDLQWAVGGAAVKWQLTNGSVAQTCAQAGVTTVYVNFLDQDNQWVYPGAGDPQSCTKIAVPYDYLLPGTYRIYIQAAGMQYDYESNFANPPTVTVQAGSWPQMSEAINVLVYRL
jgi:hypothetical protein